MRNRPTQLRTALATMAFASAALTPSRRSVREPWSTPTTLGPQVNTEFPEVFPFLSFDAETLVFQSTRPGGAGGSDLYVSTRERLGLD